MALTFAEVTREIQLIAVNSVWPLADEEEEDEFTLQVIEVNQI